MDLQKFTTEVEAQFMDCEDIKLLPDTPFRDNDYFDSLTGMSILVMIKDNFGYQMSVPDFLNCNTSSDLYNHIQQNTNE
ncbi:MAG: acyl carrier protein [Paludibacter sp.]|nr:acyl carrier protein [Paludibacter sp.]